MKDAYSVFTNQTTQTGTSLPFSIINNNAFFIPQDKENPLIMIEVSTGIAPFGALLQHKEKYSLTGFTKHSSSL